MELIKWGENHHGMGIIFIYDRSGIKKQCREVSVNWLKDQPEILSDISDLEIYNNTFVLKEINDKMPIM